MMAVPLFETHDHWPTVGGLAASVQMVLIYGAIGSYLTFGGRRFISLICPPEDRRPVATPKPSPEPDWHSIVPPDEPAV